MKTNRVILIFVTLFTTYCSARPRKTFSDKHDRTIRAHTLENGMKAILIHDPEAVFDSINLSVGAGTLQNPTSVQGLAHLVEHILVLDLCRLVTLKGGEFEAFTHLNRTKYVIELHGIPLKEVLLRVRDVVFFPHFNATTIQNEAKIVNHEFIVGYPDLTKNLHTVLKVTSKKGHPFQKFSNGNFETLWSKPTKLGIEVLAVVTEFHRKHYVPENAGIVVISSYGNGTDDIQDLVESVYSPLQKSGTTDFQTGTTLESPWGSKELGTKIEIVKDPVLLHSWLLFPISPDLEDEDYYKAVFESRHNKSLYSHLKSQGYILSLYVRHFPYYHGFTVLGFGFHLTNLGFEKTTEIVQLFYEFVAFLRKKGPSKNLRDDLQTARNLKLSHSNKEKCLTLVKEYGKKILGPKFSIPPLIGTPSNSSFDEEKFRVLLKYLNPDNMRITVHSPAFKNKTSWFDFLYGLNYNFEPIETKKLREWRNASSMEEVELPPKNLFIPESLAVKEEVASAEWYLNISKTELSDVWYQSWNYNVSKVVIKMKFFSNISVTTERDCVQKQVIAAALSDALSPISKQLQAFGGELKISHEGFGLEVSIYSFSDGIERVLNEIMETIASPFLDRERFDVSWQNCIGVLKDWRNRPCSRSFSSFDQVLKEYGFLSESLEDELFNTTYFQVEEHLQQLFSRMRIVWLFSGNLVEKEAHQMVEDSEAHLQLFYKSKGILRMEFRLQSEDLELKKGVETVLSIPGPASSFSTCALALFQPDKMTDDVRILEDLVLYIIRYPFYEYIRQERQLGYNIMVGMADSPLAPSLYPYVEGGQRPSHVAQEITGFLRTFKDTLSSFTGEEFQEIKDSLWLSWSVSSSTLLTDANHYWHQMSLWYQVCGNSITKEKLDSITLSDVLKFYDEIFGISNNTARKLSMKFGKDEDPSDAKENVDFINLDTLKEWKLKQNYLPWCGCMGCPKSKPEVPTSADTSIQIHVQAFVVVFMFCWGYGYYYG